MMILSFRDKAEKYFYSVIRAGAPHKLNCYNFIVIKQRIVSYFYTFAYFDLIGKNAFW